MPMERILVCVDGSKYSEEAVRHALVIAKGFSSSITLISVFATQTAGATEGILQHDKSEHEVDPLSGAERILIDADMTYDIVKAIGNPAYEIVQESKKGYDLVIMGSRGLGGIEGLILGSVTRKVSHHITIPLLIIPPKGSSTLLDSYIDSWDGS